LPHADRQSNVGVIRFSPDGTRLMMCGYPSGIVQVWDTRTWKETSRIDTPSGLRSSWDYALPTPDWKSVVGYVMSRKLVREEKDGKVKDRVQVDGRLDLYDTASGKRTRSIPLADRGPQQAFIVPGGKAVLLQTMGSFAAGPDRPVATELVDLTSGTVKKLFDSQSQPAFASDGKTAYFAITRYRQGGEFENSLVKYDLVGNRVLKTKEKKDKQTYFASPALSPDGKHLFVNTGRQVKLRSESLALAVLDSETFAEVARIPCEGKVDNSTMFDKPLFTPDGQTMITRCNGRLIVWDMTANRVVRSIDTEDFYVGRSLVSPDGKTVVVAGIPKFDARRLGRSADADDLPQPRLLLIDLADPNSKPQVLMLPNGMLGGAAFSRDGKTLAVGGAGGIHLIDASARSQK
jgi:WD40 repeat protein